MFDSSHQFEINTTAQAYPITLMQSYHSFVPNRMTKVKQIP